MAGFTKHLSTHVYFHMDRSGQGGAGSSAPSQAPGKKPSSSPASGRLQPSTGDAAPRRRDAQRPALPRTRSEASETGGAPPPPAPSRYEPTSSDWDDFDYFCQSPYLLSMPPTEAPPRERFKRRLFRRSHREKYGSDQDRALQRHQEPQTSTSADRVRCGSRSSETAMGDWQRRQPSIRRSPVATSGPMPGSQRSLLGGDPEDDLDDEELGEGHHPLSHRGDSGRGRADQAMEYQPDYVIVSSRTMDRFLPAFGQEVCDVGVAGGGVSGAGGGAISPRLSSSGGSVSVEVAEPTSCIVVDFCENAGFTCHDLPSPTTELAPMPRDWIAMQLGRQRQAFAWLQQASPRTILEGLLLMNVERNSQFPFVTYLVCDAERSDPFRLILQMESHQDAGPEGERLHHTAAYEEVATIARPPVDVVPRKPTSSKTGYILSAFRVFPGEDREKLDRSWLLWTGARQIYRRLPPHLGLRRITFHKKICPVDHGITYVLLCECPSLMDYVPEACVLVDQLRARCCGYTALYRVVDAF